MNHSPCAPYEQTLMKNYGVDLEYIAIESGTAAC